MKKLFVLIFSALLFCSLAAGAAPKKLKVGLFVDFGAKGNGVLHLASLIAHSPQTELVTLMAEINQGIMRHLDYLVMPHGNKKVIHKYMGQAFSQQQLKMFMERGGVILAAGNAAGIVPKHKNAKSLPEKVDFKKYILK